MCEIKNDLRLSKNGQKPLIYIEKSVVIYVFGESISTTPKRKVARSNRAGDAKTAVMRRLFRLLRHIFFFSFSVKLIFMLLKQLSQIFPHPKATSSSIISANPRAAPTVPTLLCSSDRDSGISSSMTT